MPASVGVTTIDEKKSATATTIVSSSRIAVVATRRVGSRWPSTAPRTPINVPLMQTTTSARVPARPRNLPATSSQRATGFERMLRIVRFPSSFASMFTPRATAITTPKSEIAARLKSFTNFVWSPSDADPKSAATATTSAAKARME
jgi:hypothetical protein